MFERAIRKMAKKEGLTRTGETHNYRCFMRYIVKQAWVMCDIVK
jgi:hypothetical protein